MKALCLVVDSNPPPTRWSLCTLKELLSAYSNDLGYCLLNVPDNIYDAKPACGNRIVEEGEDCDCGKNAPIFSVRPLSA